MPILWKPPSVLVTRPSLQLWQSRRPSAHTIQSRGLKCCDSVCASRSLDSVRHQLDPYLSTNSWAQRRMCVQDKDHEDPAVTQVFTSLCPFLAAALYDTVRVRSRLSDLTLTLLWRRLVWLDMAWEAVGEECGWTSHVTIMESKYFSCSVLPQTSPSQRSMAFSQNCHETELPFILVSTQNISSLLILPYLNYVPWFCFVQSHNRCP